MRISIICTLLFTAFCFKTSFAQITIPAASPGAKISQNIGLAEITIDYSRPGAKGRKVMGEVVPYGKVWRMGANSPTKITSTRSFAINGKELEAGTHTLFSIIEKTGWTLIVSGKSDIKSINEYNEKDDKYRITSKIQKTARFVESFTISFENLSEPGKATLALEWENSRATFEITQNFDNEVVENIEKTMAGEPGYRDYYNAANYYFGKNIELKKADEWALKAAEMNPAFWTWHFRAKTAAKAGDKKAAAEAANKSTEMAKEAGNQEYVELNRKLLDSLK